MSSFVALGSQQISLAKCSCSSFALFVSCLCAIEDLLPPLLVMSMRAVSGRSRLMRAGFPTRTRRHRSSEEVHTLLG
jgi:hypothetical protein